MFDNDNFNNNLDNNSGFYSNNSSRNDYVSYDTINDDKKSQHNKKYISRKAAIALISVCVVVSIALGFAGGYISKNFSINLPKLSDLGIVNKDVDNKENETYQPVVKTTTGTGDRQELTITEVVKRTSDSVVEITTEVMMTGNRMQQYITKGAGSGVIISEDGYIVTNHHVIDGANKITVKMKSGESKDAKLIGTDIKTDLAVLKVDAKGLTTATFGDSSKLLVGDTAIVIGNPLGELGGSVTSGIISALDREIVIDNETMTLLQTDASVNPGNSGGALMNIYGELVGIVNAKSSGSDIEGLGFAIPSNTVRPVIDDLINYGYVKGRIEVGLSLIEIVNQQMAMMYRVNDFGVYVLKVNKGSSADKAGFVSGDKIVSIDGKEINSVSDIKKVFDAHKVNDIVDVVVDRGNNKTLKLTLSEYKPE